MLRRLGLAMLAAAFVFAAASTAAPPRALAQTPAACPTGVTVTVAPPDATAPTTVTVALAPPVNIVAATAADPTSYHLHYFVDTLATSAGTVIPAGNPKIIHSASLTQEVGPLTAGTHTVTVVLGQLNHTACDARGTVTFIVGATAAAPSAPKAGNAGLANASTSALVVVVLIAVAVAVVAAARLWTPRSRR
jgi:hypothetical protein